MITRSNAAELADDHPLVKPTSRQWKRGVLTAAVAAALWVPMQHAQALTLGRASVQSALGEPLRAEIELPDITEDEARSLQVSIATPQAFRAAGLEYNAALGAVRIERLRRTDGRMVVRLSSEQPVREPFIDLILQANWSSGRTVRDYTLLLDPPQQRQPQPVVPTAPQLPPAASRATPPPVAAPPVRPPAASTAPVAPAQPPAPSSGQGTVPAAPPVRATSPAPPAPLPRAATPAPAAPATVTVRRGDTASRIAAENRPPNISLDQMLVAMLRSNPDAFMGSNVNRLRAGAVLDLPNAEAAATIPADEASRTIAAQARDFNAYRSQLAAKVPSVPGQAQRSASGRLQAQVDDDRSAAATPDRLTLSKGGVQGRQQDEQIAREKASREAAERVAELSRNIDALSKLGGAGAAASAPAAAAPTTSASAPGPVAEPATNAAASAAPAPSPAPAASAASPPTATAVPAPIPVPDETQSSGLLDTLRNNPLLLAAAALLLALLAALGIVHARRRKAAAEEESRLQEPVESFFASSGGQHVDTGADGEAAASAVYSPSQFDTSSEVDPVAEADVYLAYGRDLQAEEILKEALRTTPERVAIHAKLVELYAKHRDAAALQATAEQAHALTGGNGPHWDTIAEHGRELLPTHPLWAAGAAAGLGAAAAGLAAAEPPGAEPTAADHRESLWPDSMQTEAEADAAPAPVLQSMPDISLDLGEDATPEPTPPAVPAAAADAQPPAPPMAEAMDFDFDVQSTYAAPLPTAAPTPAPPADSELLPFDLGSLSLDLGDSGADRPTATEAAAPEPDADDPLATKLALAEEFQAIGDDEGARALAEEVLAEATGPLKAQAERFLAELG